MSRVPGLELWTPRLSRLNSSRLELLRFALRELFLQEDECRARLVIGLPGGMVLVWVMLWRGRRRGWGWLLRALVGRALRIASREVRRIDGECQRRNLTGDGSTDSRRWLRHRR